MWLKEIDEEAKNVNKPDRLSAILHGFWTGQKGGCVGFNIFFRFENIYGFILCK